MVLVHKYEITSLADVADLEEAEPLAYEFLTDALADFAKFAARPRSGWMLQ